MEVVKMKQVYAYLRVSSRGQVENHGFHRQLTTIKSYCEKNDYQIAEIFEEQVSGTKDEQDRPVFKNMISVILDNGIKTVLVESLDRLARELLIQGQLLAYLCTKEITLISASTGENVTEAIKGDPMRKAMIQMQGVFSELDKSLLVRKLLKAREKIRSEKGKCEGPKSYKEFNPELLREAKRLRRKRKSRVRRTYKEIAELLNEQGYKARNGNLFNANSVRALLYRYRSK